MSKIVELNQGEIRDVVGGVSVVVNGQQTQSRNPQPAPAPAPNPHGGANIPSLPTPSSNGPVRQHA